MFVGKLNDEIVTQEKASIDEVVAQIRTDNPDARSYQFEVIPTYTVTITDIANLNDVDIDIENLKELVSDTYGEDASEYLNDIKNSEKQELQRKMRQVWITWLSTYKYKPTWYTLQDKEKILFQIDEDNNLWRLI